ncbi:flagellar basal body-associated FliL family protein [Haliea sp.]
MAADNEFDDVIPGAGVRSGNSPGIGKLLLISLLVSLVMSAGVGAGVYFLLKSDIAPQQQDESGEAPVAKQKPAGPPIYYRLEDSFIVNLSTQATRFLQVTVELMARDQKVITAVEKHRPLLRNNLLLLFSAQTLESIATLEGKEALRAEALAEVQAVLESEGEPAAVEDLYFTSLVVQ